MRVTEARGKESVFNGASRGRRYGGRRIERRPTAHLAFARGGDDDASRIIKKKRLSPQSIEGHFLVRCVGQNTNNSFDEDVSSSSCLPCKFWNEPPLDFFMAPLSSSSSSSSFALFSSSDLSSSSFSKVVLLRLVWRLLLFNTFGDEMEGALFQKQKQKNVHGLGFGKKRLTKESDRRSATKSAEKEEEEEGKEREKRWRTKRRSGNSTRPWNRKQPRTRRSRGCASARRLDDSRLPANKRERLYHW